MPNNLFSIFGFILLFMCFSSLSTVAQNPTVLYGESEVSVGFKSWENWSHTFGAADRYMFSEYLEGEQVGDFNNEHLELNHFTKYKLSERSAISGGLRYRFRETFDDARSDELRFIEQYTYSHPVGTWDFSHRARTEQRLRKFETIHRFRYQFEGSRSLSDHFSLALNTEALLSISPQDTPGWEQRFGIGIENSFFSNLDLSLGIQYEMEDYNKNLEHEIFLLTGVGIKL